MRAESSSSAALTSASDRAAPAETRRRSRRLQSPPAGRERCALRPPDRSASRAEETACLTGPGEKSGRRNARAPVSDRRRGRGRTRPRGGVEFRGVQSRRRFSAVSSGLRPSSAWSSRFAAARGAQRAAARRRRRRSRHSAVEDERIIERDVAGDVAIAAATPPSSSASKRGPATPCARRSRLASGESARPAARSGWGRCRKVQVARKTRVRTRGRAERRFRFRFPRVRIRVLFRRPAQLVQAALRLGLFVRQRFDRRAGRRGSAATPEGPAAAARARCSTRRGEPRRRPGRRRARGNRRRCRRGPDRVRGRPGGWRGR